jgi:ribose/xylose/arabinose/galactoside ABC-type transport system permease subunit
MDSAYSQQNRFSLDTHTLSLLVRQYSLLIILLLVTLFFTSQNPAFLTWRNATNILLQVSIVVTMAACSTFVIITGGIDLSVSSVVGLAGLLAVITLEDTGQALVPALGVGLGVGALIGLINGVVISAMKLPPIIVTLASMTIVRGIALLIAGGSLYQISGPEAFLFIGRERIATVPVPVFIFGGVTLLIYLLQAHTRFGMNVFAIGENEDAARLCGLPVNRTRILVYMLSGLGAALGGLMLAAQVSTAKATFGEGMELDVIAAIVLGGTSLRGGKGSVIRSALGALLIGEMNNGLSMLNVSTDQQLIAKGIMIVLGIALNDFLYRWSEK